MKTDNTLMSRRRMLEALGVLGTAALSSAGAAHAIPRHRLKSIGIQLYSVREIFNSDPIGTLKLLKNGGFEEVEFAGTAGKSAPEMAAILKDIGLKGPSTHVSLDDLMAKPDTTLEWVKELGCQYVVVPWLNDSYRGSGNGWKKAGADLTFMGEKAKKHGLRLAYHNHDFEFKPVGQTTGYDLLLAHTDPALVSFELDCFWSTHAGVDTPALIKAQAARIRLLHIKDRKADGSMTEVGAGLIDYASILKIAAKGAVEHVFVEQDDAPAPYITSVVQSLNYLKGLRY